MTRFYTTKVTPKTSEEIQKKLFLLGYRWASGDKVVRYIDKPYLSIPVDCTIKNIHFTASEYEAKTTSHRLVDTFPVLQLLEPDKDGNYW